MCLPAGTMSDAPAYEPDFSATGSRFLGNPRRAPPLLRGKKVSGLARGGLVRGFRSAEYLVRLYSGAPNAGWIAVRSSVATSCSWKEFAAFSGDLVRSLDDAAASSLSSVRAPPLPMRLCYVAADRLSLF
ncbi:unnamed protein product [Ixodes pacificus]